VFFIFSILAHLPAWGPVRAKALPQFVEVRSSGLAHQPAGLPCAERGILSRRVSIRAIEDKDFLFEGVEVAAVGVFAIHVAPSFL